MPNTRVLTCCYSLLRSLGPFRGNVNILLFKRNRRKRKGMKGNKEEEEVVFQDSDFLLFLIRNVLSKYLDTHVFVPKYLCIYVRK